MAPPAPTAENRLSFARVTASQAKENVPLSYAKMAAGTSSHYVHSAETNSEPVHLDVVAGSQARSEDTAEDLITEERLADAFKTVRLTPSLIVNGSGIDNSERSALFDNGSPDDLFQRTDSGSDLGTKPPSLDGKSIASGTTFALDEKESLRPDDSASVKAAEDDDTFSGRGSIVAGSRIGSEAAARAYRAQTYESHDRRPMLPALDSPSQGVLTPQSGSSGPRITDGLGSKPLASPVVAVEGFSLFYKHTPDDKLIEAMESPKDRIFLLRLEQDVIEFVKDSKEPFIDLPPCNSFCRMLTHKLADYYHMTHQFDAVAGSVRIFRTPFCRLPQSLSSISNPPTSGNTPPPPAIPAMKIMRRGGDNGGGPSKSTSDNGSDGRDKGLSAKEKLSREEREAQYIAARERIFGSAEKSGEATPDTEEGNDMSRSSSVSGKAKRGKKKQRADSESFDVRSQYTPFFPPQQSPAWQPAAQYAPMGAPQYGIPMQNSYGNPSNAPFGPSSPQFHPTMVPAGPAPYPMAQQFQRTSPPNYQHHTPPMPAYGSASMQNSPQQQSGPWPPMNYQQPQPPFQSRGMMHVGQTIPYAYGQLPTSVNPADPKSQHPIPGSFNRHAFNPKTQSFVPGSGGLPLQPIPMGGSPNMPYNNGFNAPQPYGHNTGYNMSRQSSSTSMPSYHASPHMAPRPMMPQNLKPHMVPGPNPGVGHIPHFAIGSLPPKPPPTA